MIQRVILYCVMNFEKSFISIQMLKYTQTQRRRMLTGVVTTVLYSSTTTKQFKQIFTIWL